MPSSLHATTDSPVYFMPLHFLSARQVVTSLWAPHGSPAGAAHQSSVREPHSPLPSSRGESVGIGLALATVVDEGALGRLVSEATVVVETVVVVAEVDEGTVVVAFDSGGLEQPNATRESAAKR